MAEETKTNVETTTETNVTDNAVPNIETVSKSEYDKLKATLDKALKEKGDITKQYRAKLSEEERLSAEREEAQRIKDEENEAIKAELNRMKAITAYKDVSSDKVVDSLIDAVSNADHNAIAKIIADECKKAVANAEASWLKDRPRVQHGDGSSMTKSDIMAIKDPIERQRKIAENINLFK